MKKKHFRKQTTKLLIEIHRGFLTKEASDKLLDKEILSMIPNNSVTYKYSEHEDGVRIANLTIFTEKWVRKLVKKNNKLTSYDLLVKAGFKEPL